MSNRTQQTHSPVVHEFYRDGDASSDGNPGSNGHATIDGDGQPALPQTDQQLVDVAALLAENEGLRQRLASQPVIEQAKGILMGYYGISGDTAFELLRRWSQDTNTKLRRVAELLSETATHQAGSQRAPHQIVQDSLASPGDLAKPHQGRGKNQRQQLNSAH
jgi:hypothetical protein